jgi:hypothetical protein
VAGNRKAFLTGLFLALGFAGIGRAAPTTDVVFGNLGSSGTTGALSTTNTGITDSVKVAQVFTTNTGTNERLSAITLGAYSSVGATLGLSVFNDAGGVPGTLFAASTDTNTLGTNTNGALVTWSFNNVLMNPSTNYWIVPSTDLNWNFRSSFVAFPTQQNSSGYGYAGAYESSNGGTNWALVDGGAAYAVSVQAVPEPSTYAMAVLGMAVAAFAARRRRVA